MMKKIITVAALAAAMIMLGGVAVASIPSADGVINGCRKNSTGDLRVIDSAASCPNGFTPLKWNQMGPQGPAGANGVSGLETRSATATADANSIKSVAVVCSSGKKALGGGVELGNAGADMDLIASVPQGATGDGSDNANGWAGVVNNHESTPKLVYVWVICASV
jgi:hypothetical protein